MNEDFLYYLWTYKLVKHNPTITTGEQIQIITPGIRNHDSGPDFFNAMIKIGETSWAGNVEMHVNSSDWFKHKHQNTIRMIILFFMLFIIMIKLFAALILRLFLLLS